QRPPVVTCPRTGSVAEVGLCLWLMVKGVNVARWEERARAELSLPFATWTPSERLSPPRSDSCPFSSGLRFLDQAPRAPASAPASDVPKLVLVSLARSRLVSPASWDTTASCWALGSTQGCRMRSPLWHALLVGREPARTRAMTAKVKRCREAIRLDLRGRHQVVRWLAPQCRSRRVRAPLRHASARGAAET